MLTSLLLHLDGSDLSESVVRLGVAIATGFKARIRGLAIVDVPRMAYELMGRETAVYADFELNRMEQLRSAQDSAHTDLSTTCLHAGLDFDIRRRKGDPVELILRESQFHDLVVTAVCDVQNRGRSTAFDADIRRTMALLQSGVQPLLVVRGDMPDVKRVLLAYDGSPASGLAIKTFVASGLWPAAELRLLSVHKSADTARDNLAEMSQFIRPRRQEFETGFIVGAVRPTLLNYMEKWQPDVMVVGMTRKNPVVRRLLGELVSETLRKSSTSLYVSG